MNTQGLGQHPRLMTGIVEGVVFDAVEHDIPRLGVEVEDGAHVPLFVVEPRSADAEGGIGVAQDHAIEAWAVAPGEGLQ